MLVLAFLNILSSYRNRRTPTPTNYIIMEVLVSLYKNNSEFIEPYYVSKSQMQQTTVLNIIIIIFIIFHAEDSHEMPVLFSLKKNTHNLIFFCYNFRLYFQF